MKREEKNTIITDLQEKIKASKHFYVTDISELNAQDTSLLRRRCHEKDIRLVVVKNTLLKKALEALGDGYNELYNSLKNSTSIMFCDAGNVPAKLIKEFRKEHERPILKAAYVEETIYVGEEQLDVLSSIKSKEELIGDVVFLLQSPMNNLLSFLQSGKNKLTGVLKTIAEKN